MTPGAKGHAGKRDPTRPTVTVVVPAFGDEPLLGHVVRALIRSADICVDVVVVDNGCAPAAIEDVRKLPSVTVLRPGGNSGFAGGCNLGASGASSEFIAFVNSDAVVEPGALAALARAAGCSDVGIATASVRLLRQPGMINTVGNPVHYLLLSWAGGLHEGAEDHQESCDVASASGAAMMLRSGVWRELGGFFEPMFAYCEDTELSLRTWQQGLRVRYVPDAVVHHDYEFSRNGRKKWFLLERNRLICLFTLYEARTLLLLSPAIVVFEVAILALSIKEGWVRQKVAGWFWLLTQLSTLRKRRGWVQAARCRSDSEIAEVLTARLPPAGDAASPWMAQIQRASQAYWIFVRRHMERRRQTARR